MKFEKLLGNFYNKNNKIINLKILSMREIKKLSNLTSNLQIKKQNYKNKTLNSKTKITNFILIKIIKSKWFSSNLINLESLQ